jgi:D-serine deaminase-like pyridoxal phosphate-dependent protein
VRVVPNHVCNAVNLADDLHVVRNGELVDRWPVAARGANT